jgi:hypothetical protein
MCKHRFGVQLFQNPALCTSTVQGWVWYFLYQMTFSLVGIVWFAPWALSFFALKDNNNTLAHLYDRINNKRCWMLFNEVLFI